MLDTRESLLDVIDDVNRTSLDPYATFRSAYRQQRRRQLLNQGGAAPDAMSTGIGVGTGAVPRR